MLTLFADPSWQAVLLLAIGMAALAAVGVVLVLAHYRYKRELMQKWLGMYRSPVPADDVATVVEASSMARSLWPGAWFGRRKVRRRRRRSQPQRRREDDDGPTHS